MVEFRAGELFPRVGFIVTNLETPSRAVVRFYNKRGTAEQWIKEGKQAVQVSSGICLQRVGVRRGVANVGWNLGQFWVVLARIADRWERSG